MTEASSESDRHDGAPGASGDIGVAAAGRRPWQSPKVIVSNISGTRIGSDAYEDGAISTNYRPS
jgi:hypothetical protein